MIRDEYEREAKRRHAPFASKGFSLKFCFVLSLKVWVILFLLWKTEMIQYGPCEVI